MKKNRARLKKENPTRLSVINLLLEQADEDIGDDYELEGEYNGSVLNAVCRYLCRYSSVDEYVADITSSSDEGISSTIACHSCRRCDVGKSVLVFIITY